MTDIAMSGMLEQTRRSFFVMAGGLACAVMFVANGAEAAGSPPTTEGLKIDQWLRLFPDGSVEVMSPAVDMGQGTPTAMLRFVAEELDADWGKLRCVAAPADEKLFANPFFWDIQVTAGSRTCLGYFEVLRIAGARARHVLMLAASEHWEVPLDELTTEPGQVLHRKSGKSIGYGELVPLARIPSEFPSLYAPDEKVQLADELFGPPPESKLAKEASDAEAIRLKTRQEYRLIGKRGQRVDIPEKVSGAARYGIDVELADMVVATVVTAPVRDDVPVSVDDAAALAVPGVHEVVELPYGVAIVGDSMAAVMHARGLLAVEWGSGPRQRRHDSDETLREFLSLASTGNEDTVRIVSIGDADALDVALSDSGVVSFAMRSEFVYHGPIEPQNATIRIADDGKSAEVWVGSQWPQKEREVIAEILDIEADAVHLHPVMLGGSFGRRQEPGAVFDAAHLARKLRRPVKVVWSREEDLKRNPFRQAMACRVDAAVGEDGRISAIRHGIVADSWFARQLTAWYEQMRSTDPGNWVGGLHRYNIPLQRVDTTTVRGDVDVCYLRGVGAGQVKFAQETIVDMAAAQARVDPVEYRHSLLAGETRALEVLDAVASASGWHARNAQASDIRAPGVSFVSFSNSMLAVVADVGLDRSSGRITVHEVWCAVDVGLAALPDGVASQIEGGITQGLSFALKEQVTLKGGVVEQDGFVGYQMLRMSEAPAVHVQVIQTDNPMGGAGEIGILPIAPAINSALVRMCGKPVSTLPMLPASVKAQLLS